MGHYLLTGAAGFIANNVARQLLADGHTVVGVDNINDAYDPRLKTWRLQQIQDHPKFTFCQIDICDRPALSAVWESSGPFDAVINLAARAGVRQSVENPWIYFDTNTTGTLNLLELCRQSDTRKFVIASSSSLYGTLNSLPYSEDDNTDHPISPYAVSKKAAETLCYTYHTLYGIDVTVFRYFTVYGPAGRPDMSMFRFIQWIKEGRPVQVYGDGQQSRDFTYVDDIARGTILGLKPLGYEIINLGSDRPVVLMEIIHAIEELLGVQAELQWLPRHQADVPATWANIEKARRLLEWETNTHYTQGIANSVEWYLRERDWAKDIRT
jgi:UDP-glucuronate 4-epimerase